MFTRIKFKHIILAYLLNVLLFASLYWIAWYKSPDYFIVNQEINLTPLFDLQSFLQINQPSDVIPDVGSSSEGLDVLSLISEEKYSEYLNLAAKISDLEEQAQIYKRRYDEVYDKFSEALEANFDEYFQESMRDLNEKEALLAAQISIIENSFDNANNSQEITALGDQLSELTSELGVTRVEIARKKSELLNEQITNREKFFDPVIETELDNSYELYDKTETQLYETKNQFYQLRGEVYREWTDRYHERIERLGFVDFLYFSLTISMSNSFGDILPNHSLTRALVLLQLIFNIVIVGALVSIIVDRITKGNRKTLGTP